MILFWYLGFFLLFVHLFFMWNHFLSLWVKEMDPSSFLVLALQLSLVSFLWSSWPWLFKIPGQCSSPIFSWHFFFLCFCCSHPTRFGFHFQWFSPSVRLSYKKECSNCFHWEPVGDLGTFLLSGAWDARCLSASSHTDTDTKKVLELSAAVFFFFFFLSWAYL